MIQNLEKRILCARDWESAVSAVRGWAGRKGSLSDIVCSGHRLQEAILYIENGWETRLISLSSRCCDQEEEIRA